MRENVKQKKYNVTFHRVLWSEETGRKLYSENNMCPTDAFSFKLSSKVHWLKKEVVDFNKKKISIGKYDYLDMSEFFLLLTF